VHKLLAKGQYKNMLEFIWNDYGLQKVSFFRMLFFCMTVLCMAVASNSAAPDDVSPSCGFKLPRELTLPPSPFRTAVYHTFTIWPQGLVNVYFDRSPLGLNRNDVEGGEISQPLS
jgi:hypothetical protein